MDRKAAVLALLILVNHAQREVNVMAPFDRVVGSDPSGAHIVAVDDADLDELEPAPPTTIYVEEEIITPNFLRMFRFSNNVWVTFGFLDGLGPADLLTEKRELELPVDVELYLRASRAENRVVSSNGLVQPRNGYLPDADRTSEFKFPETHATRVARAQANARAAARAMSTTSDSQSIPCSKND